MSTMPSGTNQRTPSCSGKRQRRVLALGGMGFPLDVEAYLYGALIADVYDRDLLAVALNERFAERGGDHPMPYSDD